MSGTAQLQITISSNQRKAAEARSQAASLQAQAAQIQKEVAELELQLHDMRSFKLKAQHDFTDIETQLVHRRHIMSQIREIENLTITKKLFERMAGDCIPNATSMLQRSRNITADEVQRAERELERCLTELRNQFGVLQNQIAQQHIIARTCDQNAQIASINLRYLQQNNS